MKTNKQKRDEAIERMKSYSYEDSKAKRNNTLTEQEWQTKRNDAINHCMDKR